MKAEEFVDKLIEATANQVVDPNIQVVDEDDQSYEVIGVDDQGGDGPPCIVKNPENQLLILRVRARYAREGRSRDFPLLRAYMRARLQLSNLSYARIRAYERLRSLGRPSRGPRARTRARAHAYQPLRPHRRGTSA